VKSPGSQRLENLSSNYFSTLNEKISDLVSKGNSVIRLDIGSPDLPPPTNVIEQLSITAELPSSHGYQAHRGSPSFRQAWADHYKKKHGVDLDPDSQILPLIGSKEGIFHLSLALIDPGDLVLIPDPGYQTYTAGTRFAGGIPRFVSCLSGDDFINSLRKIPTQDLNRTKLMWVNFPHNPTGSTISLDQARQLVDFTREHDILLCHDAAYSQVVYGEYKAPSLLEGNVPGDNIIEFNSLSKSHNMAGWRLGMIAGSQDILQKLLLVKTHADSGQFLPMMEAGIQALKTNQSWLDTRNLIYQSRRDLVVDALSSLDMDMEKPSGAIYIWFPVPGKLSSEEFTSLMLERYMVALTPGNLFGSRGEGFIRLSITAPKDQLQEGLNQLFKGIQSIR
jgi:LL-diaminopimelate aminotransferase